MHAEPQKSPQGYYVFRRAESFIWWKAWATWLRDELGQRFTPDTLQAFTQFPPETQGQADLYAEYVNGIRKRINWGQSVPEHPNPWRRWTPTEMNRFEREEFEANNPPVRKSPAEIDAMVAATRKRYGRVFRRNNPEFGQAKTEFGLTHVESDPEVLQEMRDRMAAKIADRDAWREAAQ